MRGTRPDRLNPDEPKPEGKVQRPSGLSTAAGKVWTRLARVCTDMGTLTVADVPAFARLCELQATAEAASAVKDSPGFQMFSESGMPHRVLKIERETATALRAYYDYFGMTPSGRARIRVPKAEKPASKWAGVGIG